MKIIAGLGNPEHKYQKNRHNIGHILLDSLNLDWQEEKRFEALVSREGDTLYVKPQVFMNNSGVAISKVANFYKIDPKDITIIHDDLDLSFGKIKRSFDSGAAGHHGVEDIILKLGTKKFHRIRFGVGRPHNGMAVNDFVLSNFTEEEFKEIKKIDLKEFLL